MGRTGPEEAKLYGARDFGGHEVAPGESLTAPRARKNIKYFLLGLFQTNHPAKLGIAP